MAVLSGELHHLETAVYDCKYLERLSFAFQGKGGGLIEIWVSEDSENWVQFGRYESANGMSVENQLMYMPRFCKATFNRFGTEKMLCVIQKTEYILEFNKEYGLEELANAR